MKAKWIIEKFGGDSDVAEALKKEVEIQGHEVLYLDDYEPFGDFNGVKTFDIEEPVIVQGSIQFIKQLQREKLFYYGEWCKWDEFRCQEYYAQLGEYIVNQDYMMMPLIEAHRRQNELLEIFNGNFFIRPDAGDKGFTGMVITGVQDLNSESRAVNTWKNIIRDHYKETLVVVAPVRTILNEWRMVVVDKEIITGSHYKENGKLNILSEEHAPQEVFDFAAKVRKTKWAPAPVWIMDICRTKDGNLHLLEIGAFNCAGLYGCNLSKIVSRVSKKVIDTVEEYRG